MTLATTEIDLTDEQRDRAQRLHRESIIIDGSVVVAQTPEHLATHAIGGATAVNNTVTLPNVGLETALEQVSSCTRFIESHPERLILCRSVEDIHEAKRSGREAIIYGPQDSLYLGTDLSLIDTFYDLGLRIMQLTYQHRNHVADGCGESRPSGLSRFGQKVVPALQQRGILIDLSHCSRETLFDTVELAERPVVLTHAHAAAVTEHIRAKSDEELRAIASTGGIVGITTFSIFNMRTNGVRPTVQDWLAHVDYMVDLLGPDHVGVGTDIDETADEQTLLDLIAAHPEFKTEVFLDHHESYIAGMETLACYPLVTQALVSHGYDDETIRKILGGNFLRVFEQAWNSAS